MINNKNLEIRYEYTFSSLSFDAFICERKKPA